MPGDFVVPDTVRWCLIEDQIRKHVELKLQEVW